MTSRLPLLCCIVVATYVTAARGQIATTDAPAGAKPTQVRNILYIISDDLKASVLSCYGDKVCKTPNIDRLAERGMVFNRAYCQGVWCAPSRASLMFSRYKGYDREKLKSFPQFLKDKGYYSARVSKIYHMAIPRHIVSGEDGPDHAASWTQRFNCKAPETYTPGAYQCLNINDFKTDLTDRQGAGTKHRPFVAVQADGDGSNQPDPMAAKKAIELLRANKDKPFVLAVGFVRPHYPMVAPRKYFDAYPHKPIAMPERREGDWNDIPKAGIARSTSQSTGIDKYPDNQKRMWASYYATVTFMDHQVGKLLDELDRLGLRDSTAVVFTADHGYHLGEHDFWQKQNLHEEVTRVPLIVSVPGVKPAVSDSLVELADIYPTVVELVGFTAPAQCHGLSLLPILADPKASIRKYAFSYQGNTANAIRGTRWAYIRYEKGGEELFDMTKDPGQFTNLAKSPNHRAALAECRRALDEKLQVK